VGLRSANCATRSDSLCIGNGTAKLLVVSVNAGSIGMISRLVVTNFRRCEYVVARICGNEQPGWSPPPGSLPSRFRCEPWPITGLDHIQGTVPKITPSGAAAPTKRHPRSQPAN
jgi:hypothetical protein